MLQYFKVCENLISSGLPDEGNMVEVAKQELKKEKWIKRYHDLQACVPESKETQSGAGAQTGSYVRMKTIDVLVKDFQNSELL